MKNTFFVFISVVFSMALHGANSVQTEGLDTTGGRTVEIASGDTLEITGKITGSGLLTTSGSGTLVLSNPENDWTGGITVGQGSRLKVTSQGALGTGKLKISYGSGSAGYVTFAAPGARFENAIEYGRSSSEICFAADTVLAGKISIGNNDSLIYALEGVTAVIEGEVYGSNSRPLIVDNKNASCKGSIIFKGKVGGKQYFTEWYGQASGGRVYLANEENSFAGIYIGTMCYVCSNANVLADTSYVSLNKKASSSGALDLNGYDQTIGYFSKDKAAEYPSGNNSAASVRSETPATLTVKGGGPATMTTCGFALCGKVSLVIDSAVSATNRFLNLIHDTEGDITVNSGCLYLSGANAAFSRIGSLTVAADGAFFCDSSASKPLPDGISLTVESGAQLRLPKGVVLSVSSLTVDGVKKDFGVYTSAEIPALVSGAVLVMPSGEKSLVWTGEGQSEKVSDADNWSSQDVDFGSQIVAAGFAASGNRAVIDRDVYFSALDLTADDFTFAAGGGTMAVFADSIGFAVKEGKPVRKFAFEAPMLLDRNLSVVLPANTEFRLSGDVSSALSLHTISLDASASGASVVLDGIAADGNLTVETAYIDGVGKAKSFMLTPDSVNRINGKLTVADASAQGMYLRPGSELTVAGGINTKNGCLFGGGGRLIVTGRPFVCNLNKECRLSGSTEFEGTPELIFNAAGNTVNLSCDGYGGVIDCRVSGAFAGKTHLKMDARWDGASVLKLNSTTQDWTSIDIKKTKSGSVTVNGGVGACIKVSGSGNSSIMASNGKINVLGEVSILKSGSGTMTISNCTFDTAAEYDVSGGTFALAQKMLHPDSVLRLSGDGVIKLADGISQKFSAVYVDGVKVRPGNYDYASAPALLKAHMAETTGRIRIPGGMYLTVR